MAHEPPRFELRRIDADGSVGEPQFYGILEIPFDTGMSRRGLFGLGAAFGAGAVAASLAANTVYAQIKAVAPLAHKGVVTRLRFSSDDMYLLSVALDDRKVKLWDVSRRILMTSYIEQPATVADIAFTSTSASIVSIDEKGGLRTFSLDGARAISERQQTASAQWRTIAARANVLAEVRGGSSLYVGSTLAAVQSGLSAKTDATVKPPGLLLGSDGRTLVSFYADGSMQSWSEVKAVLRAVSGRVRPKANLANDDLGRGKERLGAALSADGSRLAVLGGGVVQLFEVAGLGAAGEFTVATQRREAVAFGAELIAVGITAGSPRIQLWSARDKRLLGTSKATIAEVTALEFDSSEQLLASGHADGTVCLWSLPAMDLDSTLFDRAINTEEAKARSYDVKDIVTGVVRTYTMPCGTPIPAGAVCTCNCIGGVIPVARAPVPAPVVKTPVPVPTAPAPAPVLKKPTPIPTPSAGGSHTVCTCNKVCVCIPVCQAHRLLDDDPAVRKMAEAVLVAIGPDGRDYMEWAAASATSGLRHAIEAFRDRMMAEHPLTTDMLPSGPVLRGHLLHDDEVVSIMAAQCLRLRQWLIGDHGNSDIRLRIENRLARAAELDWRSRQ